MGCSQTPPRHWRHSASKHSGTCSTFSQPHTFCNRSTHNPHTDNRFRCCCSPSFRPFQCYKRTIKRRKIQNTSFSYFAGICEPRADDLPATLRFMKLTLSTRAQVTCLGPLTSWQHNIRTKTYTLWHSHTHAVPRHTDTGTQLAIIRRIDFETGREEHKKKS